MANLLDHVERVPQLNGPYGDGFDYRCSECEKRVPDAPILICVDHPSATVSMGLYEDEEPEK